MAEFVFSNLRFTCQWRALQPWWLSVWITQVTSHSNAMQHQ